LRRRHRLGHDGLDDNTVHRNVPTVVAVNTVL
jgi:hypothetical protein